MSKPTFEEAVVQLQSEYRPYRVGDWLGKSWTNHWVKAELTIPDDFLKSDEEIICGSFRLRPYRLQADTDS
jgi:alpha-mannosidase